MLEWCSLRWQIEPLFRRFKSLAELEHARRHDDGSAKAWLCGKLLVALLVRKLIGRATAASPLASACPP